MRKYNLKRDIAYYQGKVIAYKELINEIDEKFVMSDFKNLAIGQLKATAEMMLAAANKTLRELEEMRDETE
jgi:ABC-type xylose transport system substrate-binding protein